MTARKPDSLKLVAGTLRRDRAASGRALPALDAIPTRPTWITDLNAVREWDRLTAIMATNRLLNQGNLGLLGQLCALHGKLIEMWTSGLAPTAALLSSYRGLVVSLGLASISAPAAHAGKPNRFTNLKRPR